MFSPRTIRVDVRTILSPARDITPRPSASPLAPESTICATGRKERRKEMEFLSLSWDLDTTRYDEVCPMYCTNCKKKKKTKLRLQVARQICSNWDKHRSQYREDLVANFFPIANNRVSHESLRYKLGLTCPSHICLVKRK